MQPEVVTCAKPSSQACSRAWQCGATTVREGRRGSAQLSFLPTSQSLGPLLELPLECNGLQAGRGSPLLSGLGDLHGPAPRCCCSWVRGLRALWVPDWALAPVCLLSMRSQTYAYSTPQLLPSNHKLDAGLAGGSRCALLHEPLCGHCFPSCGPGWIPVAQMVGTPLVFLFVSESRPHRVG